MRWSPSSLGLAIGLLSAPGPAPAQGASFAGVGDDGTPPFYSEVLGVSRDGTVAVGHSGPAFRWENGILVPLPDLPGGDDRTDALDASSDGSVVVGRGSTPVLEAIRWVNGVPQGLGDLPGGITASGAEAVSSDGSVVVGWSYSANSGDRPEAFRWENGVMVGLGDLPGGLFTSHAHDVSADGRIVVGTGGTQFGSFRWEDGVMTELGDLPGGASFSIARAISADGRVIVGESGSSLGTEAFRWKDGVMVGLGDVPGGDPRSFAHATTANGAVVVGSCETGVVDLGGGFLIHVLEACLWDAAHGFRTLESILVGLGLPIAAWTLGYDGRGGATDVSDDGRVIVGFGTNPAGQGEGWVATLPVACADTIDNDADGLVDAGDPGCSDPSSTTERPACQDGVNNDPVEDGLIDFDGGASAGLPPDEITAPDPQCTAAWKTRESRRSSRCGLGIELVLVLAPLVGLHRRRGRRS
jgi:probable HAF family extracellular repeat protein